MKFKDLSLSDKIAMLNLTANLLNQGFIKFDDVNFAKEDIIDFLVNEAGNIIEDSGYF